MSKNNDNLAILLEYKDPNSGEKLDTVLFNIGLSELVFK